MNIIINPERESWNDLAKRPVMKGSDFNPGITKILNEVKLGGDNAVRNFTMNFDGVKLKNLKVIPSEITKAEKSISSELKMAIEKAINNIYKFHKETAPKQIKTTTSKGVDCWRKPVPIDSVGLYIPGGTAPLFSSVLMLAIPAKIAGCKNIFISTPPDTKGNINPVILYAAKACGVTDIYKIGGAQAIAAMAYGTETVPKAYKIYGPGNQFVTTAKQLVNTEGTAIDMPAGPSEVLVISDETSNPEFVASDLLSQAEHGIDSQVICLTNSEVSANKILREVEEQVSGLSRKEIAEKALKNSKIIVFSSAEDSVEFSNYYAPEHLIINTSNTDDFEGKITNAGSVFLGPYTPESAGDYASGTNHTLPTNGFAKAYSGLSVSDFMKFITFQRISEEGLRDLGPAIELMAKEEKLTAHKNAVTCRLKEINKVK